MLRVDVRKFVGVLGYNEKQSEFFAANQVESDVGLTSFFVDGVGLLSVPFQANDHMKLAEPKSPVAGTPFILSARKLHIVDQDNFDQRINQLAKIIVEKMLAVSFMNIEVNVRANLNSLVVCNPGETYSQSYNFEKTPGAFGCMFVSLPMETNAIGTANIFQGVDKKTVIYPLKHTGFSVLGIAATRHITGSQTYSISSGDSTVAFLAFNLVWTDVFCHDEPLRPVSFPQFIRSAHEAAEMLRIWATPAVGNSQQARIALSFLPNTRKYAQNVLKTIDFLDILNISLKNAAPITLIGPKWLQTRDDLKRISNNLIADLPNVITQTARGSTIEKNRMLGDVQRLLKRACAHPNLSPEDCRTSLNVAALLNICMALRFEKELVDLLEIVTRRGCLCGTHDWIALYNQSSGPGSFTSELVKFVLTVSGFETCPAVFNLLRMRGSPELMLQFANCFLEFDRNELALRVVDLLIEKLKTSQSGLPNWLDTAVGLLGKLKKLPETANRCSELLKYLLAIPIGRPQTILSEMGKKKRRDEAAALIERVLTDLSVVAFKEDLKDIPEKHFALFSEILSKHGAGKQGTQLFWTKILNELNDMASTLRAKKPVVDLPLLVRAIALPNSNAIPAIAKSGVSKQIVDALMQCLVSMQLHLQVRFTPIIFTRLFLVTCLSVEGLAGTAGPGAICFELNQLGIFELCNLIVGVNVRFEFEKFPVTKQIYESLLHQLQQRDVFQVVQSSEGRFWEVFQRYCRFSDEPAVKELVEKIAEAGRVNREAQCQQLLLKTVTLILDTKGIFGGNENLNQVNRKTVDLLYEAWLKMALEVQKSDVEHVSLLVFFKSFIEAEKIAKGDSRLIPMFGALVKKMELKVLIELILFVSKQQEVDGKIYKESPNFVSMFNDLCLTVVTKDCFLEGLSFDDSFMFVKCFFWFGSDVLLMKVCDVVCSVKDPVLLLKIVESDEIKKLAAEVPFGMRCLKTLSAQANMDKEEAFMDNLFDDGPPPLDVLPFADFFGALDASLSSFTDPDAERLSKRVKREPDVVTLD